MLFIAARRQQNLNPNSFGVAVAEAAQNNENVNSDDELESLENYPVEQ